MVISRHKSNLISFFCIYDFLVLQEIGYEFDIKHNIESLCKDNYENCDTHIKECVLMTIKNFDEIKSIITANLVNWTYKRVSLINKAILFLSIAEYKYVGNIDKAIVIDNAVNLAKKYSDPDDYKFINGLLDKVL